MNDQGITSVTREDIEAQLHISYSQLNNFLLCPMKYAHNYVWGTPHESKPVALILGRAVHKAAQVFYNRLKQANKFPAVDEICDAFKADFDEGVKHAEVEITFKDGETVQTVRDQGIEFVRLFHSQIQPQEIAAVELPFSVAVPDIFTGRGNLPARLTGIFDLIERDSQGTYLIAELKTSSQRFSSLKLEYDLQATVYSYALSKLRLSTTESSCLVRYDVLIKNKKPAFEHYFVSRTEKDYEKLIHLINHVLKAIEARVFYRQTGWQCADCQFKQACLG
jgi:CRISPR/Cas system-associated exonuclease Cas4 (RecB family)